ncbi:YiaA/YiaB family inner membrane protein [Bacillus sp. 31A1R]|uniref:YiaA/YiaB family inner membrane protein n=1 Tax=Robertmurraya mangrovi TaxID=3098077 RepID=A0ABU5IVN8_9BACI|nr:YiaA/YiaB family inner membrane protein [Bacillus sp. 31A1R]MDZ5471223.1 YiaA/YiaB family inner membrane protein [Bacillus sp. 31A1R]
MRRRNTPAFTFLAWASFALACGFTFVGIYNMDAPLVEKGYYSVCSLFLIMSSFVLQKVVRDNQEDDDGIRKATPEKKKTGEDFS